MFEVTFAIGGYESCDALNAEDYEAVQAAIAATTTLDPADISLPRCVEASSSAALQALEALSFTSVCSVPILGGGGGGAGSEAGLQAAADIIRSTTLLELQTSAQNGAFIAALHQSYALPPGSSGARSFSIDAASVSASSADVELLTPTLVPTQVPTPVRGTGGSSGSSSDMVLLLVVALVVAAVVAVVGWQVCLYHRTGKAVPRHAAVSPYPLEPGTNDGWVGGQVRGGKSSESDGAGYEEAEHRVVIRAEEGMEAQAAGPLLDQDLDEAV